MLNARVEDRECAGGAVAAESWREVDRQLRRIAKRNAAFAADEARWLLAAYRERVDARVGCGSFPEYVERVLGYGPRECRERLRMAIALDELPAMRKALASGALCYSAVRELTRVATADTEAAWLEAAQGKTVGEIEPMVKGREPGSLPSEPVDPDLRTTVLRCEVPPEVYAQWREVERDVTTRVGHAATGAEVIAELCVRYFAPAKDDQSNKPPYQIAITVCEQCERAWQDGAGRAIEVSAKVAEIAGCDAQMIGRVDGNTRARATRTIPVALRRQVLRRDHGQCVVPGCRAARQFGAPPTRAAAPSPPRAAGPAPVTSALEADARLALTTLGFKAGEAWRAVAQATTRVGRDAPLEAILTAALRFLHPAPSS